MTGQPLLQCACGSQWFKTFVAFAPQDEAGVIYEIVANDSEPECAKCGETINLARIAMGVEAYDAAMGTIFPDAGAE